MSGIKKDSVPAELVGRHVREWVDRNQDKFGGFHYACRALSYRSGIDESYYTKLYHGTSRYAVRFDAADRMFCAMMSPNIWYCDDELAECYERLVAEADRIEPLQMELAA